MAAEACPESPPGSELTHQVMAATVASPARVNGAAHIAVPGETQLAGAPALEGLGAGGLSSAGVPGPSPPPLSTRWVLSLGEACLDPRGASPSPRWGDGSPDGRLALELSPIEFWAQQGSIHGGSVPLCSQVWALPGP